MPKTTAKSRRNLAVGRSNPRSGKVRTLSAPDRAPQRIWLFPLMLAIATAAIYSPVLWHPFVNYDDQAYIVENGNLRAGLTLPTLRWALTSMEESNWHPLTWLSHALDCQLFGLNPAGHHATSLVLHILNAVLLFWLLWHATGERWRSMAVAGLFALHPLNVESVAWAAERKNVLSMFFLLLTLAAYGWYARKPGYGRYCLVLVLFAGGLAAKPMIVTLPFALLLIDYWPLRRMRVGMSSKKDTGFRPASWQRLLLEKLPLVALSAASSVVTLYAQKMSMATREALPLLQRVGNAIYSYVMYLWKTVWPVHLAAFYPHEGDRLAAWRIGLCLIVLVVVSAAVWTQRRSREYLIVGWLWFLGNMVPVIGLVQVGDQGMADRYVYLPLVGIFVMAVWGIADETKARLGQRQSPVPVLGAAVVIVFAVLSLLTIRQITTWRSSYDLWAHALEVTSENYLAEDYMGSSLLEQAYQSSGQRYSDAATAHFRNAARINPHDAISHLNLGADFHEHGKLQEAIEQYTEMLRYTRDPHLLAKAYIAMGAAFGQLHEFDQAEQSFGMARQFEPDNRGLFLRMGELAMEKRIVQLQSDASAHPRAETYLALGQLQQGIGHTVDARESYEQALKLDPKLEEARNGLESISDQNR